PSVIADGVPTKDEKPHSIRVEIVEMNRDSAHGGDTIDANVRMENTGEVPIRIPWAGAASRFLGDFEFRLFLAGRHLE
ncbi:MAG: hypothetical protein ACRD4X_18475, partial [Candidatus Acidiferrales bacterium]